MPRKGRKRERERTNQTTEPCVSQVICHPIVGLQFLISQIIPKEQTVLIFLPENSGKVGEGLKSPKYLLLRVPQ